MVEATPQGGDNLNGVKGFLTENGSRQGHNMALTGLFVTSSLDRPETQSEGTARTRMAALANKRWRPAAGRCGTVWAALGADHSVVSRVKGPLGGNSVKGPLGGKGLFVHPGLRHGAAQQGWY